MHLHTGTSVWCPCAFPRVDVCVHMCPLCVTASVYSTLLHEKWRAGPLYHTYGVYYRYECIHMYPYNGLLVYVCSFPPFPRH
jgi:hypothetical protein